LQAMSKASLSRRTTSGPKGASLNKLADICTPHSPYTISAGVSGNRIRTMAPNWGIPLSR
jgi:hypothetical protein